MKKFQHLAIAMYLMVVAPLYTQASTSSAPQGINYQSVARNASGQVLANQAVHLRLSIRDSSTAGAILYQEHHQVVTNAFGTFSVVIGGGSIILGDFSHIAWGSTDKYLQTDIDLTGGNNYRMMGVSKLQSVAYALYAGTSSADMREVKYDTTGMLGIQTAADHFTASKPAWLAAGNGSLANGNDWLGTVDNKDVIIKQNGIDAIRYTAGGALLATGSAAGATPTAGPGTRLEWIPARGAFRVGSVTATQWDDAYIGTASIAMGSDALASGAGAIAIGASVLAVDSNASVIGSGLISNGVNSVTIGRFNDTAMAGGSTSAGDKPIFQVGSGTSAASRSNALTVQRDGDVYADQLLLSRSLTMAPATVSALLGPITADVRHVSFLKVNTIAVPLSSTLSLSHGSKVGQILVIQSVASLLGISLGYGFRIIDGAASNAQLAGTYAMYNGNMLTLVWDGTTWVEVSRSVN